MREPPPSRPRYVMGRITGALPGESPPVVRAMTGPNPAVKELLDAARRYREEHSDDSITLLLRAAEQIE